VSRLRRLKVRAGIPSAAVPGLKGGLGPAEWRSRFHRSYERDHCFPTAIYAAIQSVRVLLGRDPDEGVDERAVSRLIQYHKGLGAPIEFSRRDGLRRRLAMEGLIYREREGEAGAFDQLRALLTDPTTSFPLVGVALEAIAEYDTRVRIRTLPSQEFDHALVVLTLDEAGETEFFDPTLNPGTAGLVREAMPTTRFLEWWRRDPFQPFYLGWVEPIQLKGGTAPSVPATRITKKTLYAYEPTSEEVVRRRRKK